MGEGTLADTIFNSREGFYAETTSVTGTTIVSGTVTISASSRPPGLAGYTFIGKSAASTINGFFVGYSAAGFQVRVGSAFSASVNTTATSGFAQLAGGSIPTGATGAIIDISADLNFEIWDGVAFTITSGNKANYPTLVAGYAIPLGDVT